MITVMKAFNQSAHAIETRSAFWQRILSLVLIFILTVLIIVASIIQIISYNALDLFNEKFVIGPLLFKILFLLVKYLIIIIISFGAFSFIYYLAPAIRGRFRFISPGSTLATILTIIVLEVFSFFINNFGQYNKIYGSIGSMIVLIIWLNLNSRILLIGFELNASIYSAKKDKIMRDNNLEK
jgi:membrane protein